MSFNYDPDHTEPTAYDDRVSQIPAETFDDDFWTTEERDPADDGGF